MKGTFTTLLFLTLDCVIPGISKQSWGNCNSFLTYIFHYNGHPTKMKVSSYLERLLTFLGDIFGVGLSDRTIWLEIDVSNRDFRQLMRSEALFCVWFFSFVQHVCVCPTIFSSDSCNLLSFFGTGYWTLSKKDWRKMMFAMLLMLLQKWRSSIPGHFSHTTADDLGWLDFSLQLIIFTFNHFFWQSLIKIT